MTRRRGAALVGRRIDCCGMFSQAFRAAYPGRLSNRHPRAHNDSTALPRKHRKFVRAPAANTCYAYTAFY